MFEHTCSLGGTVSSRKLTPSQRRRAPADGKFSFFLLDTATLLSTERRKLHSSLVTLVVNFLTLLAQLVLL